MKTDAILNGTRSYFYGSFNRHDKAIKDPVFGYYRTTERTSLFKETSQLNDYGRSNILKTPVGDMECFWIWRGIMTNMGLGSWNIWDN